jgi:ABC-2 type transport system permease protein
MSDRAAEPSTLVHNPLADAVAGFVTQTLAVADAEVWKLRHDSTELFMRAAQPILWLLLFGEVMSKVRGLGPAGGNYLDFLAPGILAQSILFAAIFYGIATIWERDLGILHRYMVSPAPRSALVLGKAIAAAIRGLVQAAFIYGLCVILGIGIDFHPLNIALVIALIALGSGLFALFSLIIACIVKTRERFMGMGQVLTMPIFFASNAIYPIALMPDWLKVISYLNPLTYEVDALRALMLSAGESNIGIGWDFGVLAAVALVFLLLAAWLYPRMAT